MKRLNILAYIVMVSTAVFSFTACSDLLEEDVRSDVPSERYETPEGFDEAVNASYTTLRTFYARESGMSLTVFGTDTYHQGADGSFKYVDEYSTQFDATTPITTWVWNDLYQGINTTNAVVERSEDVEDLSEDEINERVAEARFLRGHYYFLLVQLFGPVHVTLEETQAPEIEASREPIDVVYEVIEEDLQFAIDNLGEDPRDYGRATKPAAEHLMARVLLTRASSDAAESDDYERAAQYAETVINDYNFELLDDFSDLWDMDNQQNEEVIWSVQYTDDDLANDIGNWAHVAFLMEYDVQPGMTRDAENGRPFKRFMPSEFTLETLFEDRENDTRYEKSFQDVFYSNNPGTYTVQGQEVTYEEGDTTIYLPGENMSDEEKEERPYLVITPDDYALNLFPSLIKHLDPRRPDSFHEAGSRDFLAFRLAETYLIAAEALMMEGQESEAVDYINEVRVRSAREGEDEAETTLYEQEMMITEGDLDIDFILDERGRELLGEQFRWFDLVRTGTLVERVRDHNPFGGDNVEEEHMLRPIPQDQIDRTDGGSDSFPQNDGY